MKSLALFFCLLVTTAWAQTTQISGGKLMNALNANGQDILAVDQIASGTGTPAGRIHLLPNGTPTTAADGIRIGSDVDLYRSAADTLTISANLNVTGTITGLGGIPRLNANQTWTGTNLFSATSTFAVSPVLQQGLTFANDTVKSQVRSGLGLVIGTNVQAFSSRLASIAAASPATGNFLMGNPAGDGWISVPQNDLRNIIGLGAASSVIFNALTLAEPLTVPNGGTGLSSTQINAANLTIYSTGAGTMAVTSLTPFARTNILAAADAATVLANLGLSFPVGVTGGGTGLTSIAQDQVLYTSAANTLSATSLAPWIRSNLLNKTSQAAAQTALALGTGSSPTFAGLTLTAPLTPDNGGTGLDDTQLNAANLLPITSGAGAFTTLATGGAGRAMLGHATAGDTRTYLGLATGSAVAFGSLTLTTPLGSASGGLGADTSAWVTNLLPVSTGSGTFTSTAISAYGKTLIAAVDATAAAALLVGFPVEVASGGTGITDVPDAGDILIGDGAGAYERAPTTSYFQGFLTKTNATQTRDYIGLGASDDVTFQSVTISSPFGPAQGGTGINLVPAAGHMLYGDGAGNYGVTNSTAFGRSVLNAVNAFALQGLADLSTVDSPTFQGLTLTSAPLTTDSGGTGLNLDSGSLLAGFALVTVNDSPMLRPAPMPNTEFIFPSGSTYDMGSARQDWAMATHMTLPNSGISATYEVTLTTSNADLDFPGLVGTAFYSPNPIGRRIIVRNNNATYGLKLLRLRSGSPVLYCEGVALPQDLTIPYGVSIRLTLSSLGWQVEPADLTRCGGFQAPFTGTIDVSTYGHLYRVVRLTDSAANDASASITVTLPLPTSVQVGTVIEVTVEDYTVNSGGTKVFNTASGIAYFKLVGGAEAATVTITAGTLGASLFKYTFTCVVGGISSAPSNQWSYTTIDLD